MQQRQLLRQVKQLVLAKLRRILQFIWTCVLPDYKIRGCLSNIAWVKKSGYYTWTRVPKVELLSSIKYSFAIFLMLEWILDTEISSAILTSQEAFLPICRLCLLSVLRMKNTFDLLNSSFWFPELRVSRIIKFSLGRSTSIISVIRLLILTENGNFYLQSSQLIFLNLMTTCPLTAFIVLFLSSQVRRHFKWMPPIVPEQLQGDIMGLNFSSVWSMISLS